MTDFDYNQIAAAREALAGRVIRTPAMPLCGSKIAPYIPDNAELFIKLELFQHTGSFKRAGPAWASTGLTMRSGNAA